MASYEDLLKRATALKRASDLRGAVAAIDEALSNAVLGNGSRPQAWKKRIYYLVLDGRVDEAMHSAEQLIAEAQGEARGDNVLVGTAYSFAFQERAVVHLAFGRACEAFSDFLRASWHWQQAMILQNRAETEFPPYVVAESLMEAAEQCGYPVEQSDLELLIAKYIAEPERELFVSRGLMLISGK